jgi:hypothetical protein
VAPLAVVRACAIDPIDDGCGEEAAEFLLAKAKAAVFAHGIVVAKRQAKGAPEGEASGHHFEADAADRAAIEEGHGGFEIAKSKRLAARLAGEFIQVASQPAGECGRPAGVRLAEARAKAESVAGQREEKAAEHFGGGDEPGCGDADADGCGEGEAGEKAQEQGGEGAGKGAGGKLCEGSGGDSQRSRGATAESGGAHAVELFGRGLRLEKIEEVRAFCEIGIAGEKGGQGFELFKAAGIGRACGAPAASAFRGGRGCRCDGACGGAADGVEEEAAGDFADGERINDAAGDAAFHDHIADAAGRCILGCSHGCVD